MIFDEEHGNDINKRKATMKVFFKGKEEEKRGRGLTIIKDILRDFENESDFAVSDNSRID